MRPAALAPLALLLGCGSTVEPTPTPTVNVKTIGVAGGTVVGQGSVSGAQVVVPFGALPQDTPISIGEDPAPPDDPPGEAPASVALLTSPEGLKFDKPATLILPYRGLSNVQLFTAPAIPGASWQWYDGGVPDPSQNVLRASISHFSRWRAFRPYVDGGAPDAG